MKYLLLRSLLLGALLLPAAAVYACINEYRTLLDGTIVESSEGGAPSGRFSSSDRAYLLQEIREADSLYRRTQSIEDFSDLGALYVYEGAYAKAQAIFQQIERMSPGRYQTAANLGTTYELLGNVDSALYWIQKAVRINPDSHGGSEWIHIKILEAMKAAKGDASYFLNHSILSLDFGQDLVPKNNTGKDLNALHSHLYDQLNERISFVKPEDPVVAQLLFDLGNAAAILLDAESGREVFVLAKKYGYKSDLMDRRMAHFAALQRKADVKNEVKSFAWVAADNPGTTLTFVAIGALMLLPLAVWFLHRIRSRSKRP